VKRIDGVLGFESTVAASSLRDTEVSRSSPPSFELKKTC